MAGTLASNRAPLHGKIGKLRPSQVVEGEPELGSSAELSRLAPRFPLAEQGG